MVETQDITQFTYMQAVEALELFRAWGDINRNATAQMGSSDITIVKDTETGQVYLKNTLSGKKARLTSAGVLVDF